MAGKYKNENYRKEYYLKNKEKHKNYALLRSYKITIEEYNSLLTQQNGCCAICGKHESETKRKLSVDHCHKTNKIRKLLCNQCNFLLGYANEDISVLQKAILYLQKETSC